MTRLKQPYLRFNWDVIDDCLDLERVRMDQDILQAVAKAREEVKSQELDLSVFDMYLEAAQHAAGFRLREGRAEPEFPPTFGTRPKPLASKSSPPPAKRARHA